MNRRDFIQKTCFLSTGLYWNALPEALSDSSIKLTILHTNDTHSRIDPFPSHHHKYPNMGGVAKRSSLIEKIRKEEKNVLLLDAGDFFQGTPYFNFFHGEVEIKALSALGYDVVTLGNHDFDAGLSGLIRQLPHANFQIVSANYVFEEQELKQKVKPYVIINKDKLRIGIFGLGVKLEGLVPAKFFANTKYIEPVEIAKELVQELKNKKVDYIICLSHLGLEYEYERICDKQLATLVEGIDLIIGGHTHTFLKEPLVVTHPISGHQTVICQVGFAGIWLGRIDIRFETTRKKRIATSHITVI
ncbi:MAG: metallophosphatase [Cytophagales bacterium]|nr:metallophosphatase [Cytophagales bacterium]MDW8385055.1 metallophosphatase [Flammeovirgaceae bacterium]